MLRGHGENGNVVAVVGDGAMTGGVAFEAVHQAGGAGTPIVVVLNDNGMSIAPNVGALSRYFNRVRLNPKLWHAREDIEGGLSKLPVGIGSKFERIGPHFKESIKAFWAPGLWWEELDWAYMGVVDGHDVRAVRRALREALAAQRPVVVHCATVKGKGFAPAEEGGLEGMEQWHAAKPHSIANGAPSKARHAPADARPAPPQYTQVFGEALLAECRRDDRVLGITAAMNSGTGLNILQQELPDRYFDVGIAEQQAVLLASGLALQGCKPVVAIYSTFLQRAFDQIVHDVCLQRLNVTFALDRAGLVGEDGPTHHGVFDIAYLRCLPNIVMMAPRDEAMLVNMLHTAPMYDDGPMALRYPRGEGSASRSRRTRRRSRSAPARSCASGSRETRAALRCSLRHRRREGTRRRGDPVRSGDLRDRRGRAVCQADRSAARVAAGGRPRVARDGRGGRARRRLRLGRLGGAVGCRRHGADPARRPARSVRHTRRSEAPARGGRLHRATDRRPDRGRCRGPHSASSRSRAPSATPRPGTRISSPTHACTSSPGFPSADRVPLHRREACPSRHPAVAAWRVRIPLAGGGVRDRGRRAAAARAAARAETRPARPRRRRARDPSARRRSSRAAGSSSPTRSTRSRSRVAGAQALDVGASTGGFTDCLLQRGAAHVVAVDVAYGELSWRLREDPRVTVIERRNARTLQADELPYAPERDRDRRVIHLAGARCCRRCSRAPPPRSTAWRWSSRSSRSAASASARAESSARPHGDARCARGRRPRRAGAWRVRARLRELRTSGAEGQSRDVRRGSASRRARERGGPRDSRPRGRAVSDVRVVSVFTHRRPTDTRPALDALTRARPSRRGDAPLRRRRDE